MSSLIDMQRTECETDLAVVLRELNQCKIQIEQLVSENNRLELALLRKQTKAPVATIHAHYRDRLFPPPCLSDIPHTI